MTSPYNHGLQTGACLPSIYTDPIALKALRTPHILFKDNYETIFKRYGFLRHEMMTVMPDFMKVDPLCGTDILPYLPAPK